MEEAINIGKMLAKRAFLLPNLEACVGSDYRYTFGEFNSRANRFAAYLTRQGLSPGDRIAILGKNNEHVVTALFGAAKLGIITVLLNWRLQVPELRYILADCGAKLLIYDHEFSPLINQLQGQGDVKSFLAVGGAGEEQEFAAVIAAMADGEPTIIGGGDDPAVIMYTSGTSGKPKGAILSHHNLFWASINLAHTIDWGYGYRFLSVAPLFHIGGLAPIMGNVHSAATTVFMPNFDPVAIWDIVEAERINFMMTVPTMLQFMFLVPQLKNKNLSAIKYFVCGGSAVPETLIKAYQEQLGIPITHVYGISEYTGAVSFWNAHMDPQKSNSMGKPVFHGDVRICAPGSDRELPPGEVGEICCLGPQVFVGYWNNPTATAEVINNGCYRSGDLGKKDEAGFLYVVDRLKDMIVSGGENIYPAELETVISSIPGVAEVAVIGKPDPKWGEIPVAFIVAKPSAELTEQDVVTVCKINLASYKCVREVRFVPALPKNAVGKILKKN